MTVSSQSPRSLLESVLSAQAARTEIGIAVLKKAQDVEKEQGAALVQLLEQSAVEPSGPRSGLDTFA